MTCRACESKALADRLMFKAYGIGHKERDSLLAAQGNKCACCGSKESGSKKGWHVDHCHKTKDIRGILCAQCNIALGMVDDSLDKLDQLSCYLRRIPYVA